MGYDFHVTAGMRGVRRVEPNGRSARPLTCLVYDPVARAVRQPSTATEPKHQPEGLRPLGLEPVLNRAAFALALPLI
jgi:hypothetical protein